MPTHNYDCYRAEGALRSTATSETERVSSSLCDNQTCHDVSTGDLKLMYVQVLIIMEIERRLFEQIQNPRPLIIFKSVKLNLCALGRKNDLI